jgi:NAD(P)H-dependent FMN reductase
MKPMNVLGVASSMRGSSYGTRTLRIVLDSSIQSNKEINDVNWADAFVLVSLDYHGSMSGSIKNFLDYYWKEFAGKIFGYICTSHEKGLTVLDQMRTAVRQCYGWSLPYSISVNGEIDFNGEGELINSLLENV